MKPCITQHCSFHDINSTYGCNRNVADHRPISESCQNYTTMKGSEMKRYRTTQFNRRDGIKLIEDPDGEYVKWEDVKSLWGTILNMTPSQFANWMDSMAYKGKIKREG